MKGRKDFSQVTQVNFPTLILLCFPGRELLKFDIVKKIISSCVLLIAFIEDLLCIGYCPYIISELPKSLRYQLYYLHFYR